VERLQNKLIKWSPLSPLHVQREIAQTTNQHEFRGKYIIAASAANKILFS